MEQENTEHVPVMLGLVLDTLTLRPGMHVVDATLGGGGYTRAMLEAVGPKGSVIALDWDQTALDRFQERVAQDEFLQTAQKTGRLVLVRSSYADTANVLHENGWRTADAIVADLGLSSDQLADPSRGLSFQTDGPLDMRLNSDETVQASHILNQWDEDRLADLFQTYGDEPEAKRIATAIVLARKHAPLATTVALRELIWNNVVPARRRGKVHPATRIFQALRIAVNSERHHLERFLQAIPSVLTLGGKTAIVSFHSGEDALVKHQFQKEIRAAASRLRWVTKKPLVPTPDEIRMNPRARSAKLRAVERQDAVSPKNKNKYYASLF